MIVVTPSLFVGEKGDLCFFDDLKASDTAVQAATFILGGWSALLPLQEGWEDKAEEILVLLGVDPHRAAKIVSNAQVVNEV